MTLAHFEDLTEINVPFGLLDEDTRERFKRHRALGFEIEVYVNGNWDSSNPLDPDLDFAYRAKPGPVVATTQRLVSVGADGTVFFFTQDPQKMTVVLTTTFHDGKPVKGTWEATE